MRLRYHRRMLPESAHSDVPLTGAALHAAKQALRAARMTARAVSYAATRTLMAGTVKPTALPWPIAMYKL